jgi:ubiquinone/menaquinone biosynthesis C-methylase UbiE
MRISDLFTLYGSDKCTLHSYGAFYDHVGAFFLLRNSLGFTVRVLEVGVGAGGCLRAWQEFLGKNGEVYGADLMAMPPEYSGPKVFGLNQGDQESLSNVSKALADEGLFDLIMDDGSHALEHQEKTLAAFYGLLKPGGCYVIEDLQDRELAKRFITYPGYQLIDMRDCKGRYDDLLVVIRREA